jgi:cytochrome d ubiquinol oxidase subunit I
MDFTELSRVQFGLTVGFHYLFAITTLGLTLYILVAESLHVSKGQPEYKSMADFLVKLLAIVFVFGVATGFMMPFAFGANWSRFSHFAGAVFGIHLVLESITAFAIEAIALGILIFGRNKVSRRAYWLAALLAFLGSHLSAFWIVSANSWLQSPAGFAVVDGRIVLTNLLAAIFNPTALIRFLHVTVASWITGTFLVAAIAAYRLLRNPDSPVFRRLLRLAIVPMLVLTVLQAGLGHVHIMTLVKHVPEKDLAYEGIFHSVRGAPLYAFGIPDEKNETIHFAIGLPYMLSFLETGSFTSEIKGLDQYPRDSWPPVNVMFTTFHLMVFLGVIMILAGAIGTYLLYKKKLFAKRWYLVLLLAAIPLPYLANELGWIGTEMGRQPWIIYGVMRTSDASTTCVPTGQVVLSLSFIAVFYSLLFVLFLRRFLAEVKSAQVEPVGEA